MPGACAAAGDPGVEDGAPFVHDPVKSRASDLYQKRIFDALYAENVHAQVHYLPVYWHSYYEKLGYPKGLCPNAEYLYEHVMSIPLFYSMTDEDVESVITAIKKVLAYYRR